MILMNTKEHFVSDEQMDCFLRIRYTVPPKHDSIPSCTSCFLRFIVTILIVAALALDYLALPRKGEKGSSTLLNVCYYGTTACWGAVVSALFACNFWRGDAHIVSAAEKKWWRGESLFVFSCALCILNE